MCESFWSSLCVCVCVREISPRARGQLEEFRRETGRHARTHTPWLCVTAQRGGVEVRTLFPPLVCLPVPQASLQCPSSSEETCPRAPREASRNLRCPDAPRPLAALRSTAGKLTWTLRAPPAVPGLRSGYSVLSPVGFGFGLISGSGWRTGSCTTRVAGSSTRGEL